MKNKLIFIVSLILTVSVNAQIYTPSGTIQGASGSNNIGIGTSTPSTKLDVLGTVKIQSSNSNYDENLRLLPSLTSDYSSIVLGAVNGSAGTGIGQWTFIRYPAANNYMFSLRYNSTDFLNILNNGNVGIGNNTPNAKLHVNGGDIVINNNGAGILRGDNYNYGSGGAIKLNSSNNVSEQYIQLGRGLSGTGAFSPHLTVMSNSGYVGIGTINPKSKMEVTDWTTALSIGSTKNTEAMVDNEVLGAINFYKHYNIVYAGAIKLLQAGDGNQYSPAHLAFYTTSGGNPYTTAPEERMRITSIGNIGIGIMNPTNKLDVNGTIHSKEVKVDMNGWSDFVFKKDYALPTLDEVEKHIAEKGHLENIPSEEEVLKNGINLGEMNSKLLQKIEELTLYMIEQNKTIEELKQEIKNIKSKI